MPRANAQRTSIARSLTILSALLHPLGKAIDIVEELSDDKVCSGITLLLQPVQIALRSLRILMRRWISRDSDAEKVSMLFTDISNQVVCVGEAIGLARWVEAILVDSRWVTPKCQNVSDV